MSNFDIIPSKSKASFFLGSQLSSSTQHSTVGSPFKNNKKIKNLKEKPLTEEAKQAEKQRAEPGGKNRSELLPGYTCQDSERAPSAEEVQD